MNKLTSIICFCLVLLFILSCERPDLTSEIERTYDSAYDSACSNQGAFRCNGNVVQKCDSNMWKDFQRCESDQTCNAGTGKCVECPAIAGNIWSPKSYALMIWSEAVSYCDNLTKCGYSDWHLPTISELRTLIQNCSGTVTGGSCGVTDSCLSSSCRTDHCDGCDDDFSGDHSKLGDTGWFWSSSVPSDNSPNRWYVDFYDGYVGNVNIDYNYYVRCVR